jgi:UDP-glucose 4-epimerase
MKIFITGGTGNIGQYVTKQLQERGHELVLLTRTPDRIPAIKALKNVTLVKGDTGELEVMGRAVQGCDAVIYIARGWGNEPGGMLDNDNKPVAYLLEQAEKTGARQFIYTSSTAAYGKNYVDGMDEDHPALRPQNLYGVAKAVNEMYVLGWHQTYVPDGPNHGRPGNLVAMKRNIIRPGYTISTPAFEGGASQNDSRMQSIVRSVLNNEDLVISEYDATQFLDSSQIAQAYVKLVESDLNEEVFLVLGAANTSWAEIGRMAIGLAPGSSSRVLSPPNDTPRPLVHIDVSKIERFFGLRFDAAEYIRACLRWLLDRERRVLAGNHVHDASHR